MKVCLISEGGYPVTVGGLSEWAQRLMNNISKEVRFDILCLTTADRDKPVYPKPHNVDNVSIVPLVSTSILDKKSRLPRKMSDMVAKSLQNFLFGKPMDFDILVKARQKYHIDKDWLLSRSYWNSLVDFYGKSKMEEPFVNFYWASLGLYSALLNVVMEISRIPKVDVYHSLSVGYAGLAGALAKLMFKRPLVITEQGFYLLERQTELARLDVSDWYRKQLMTFSEAIVKTSYHYADVVVPPSRRHIAIEEKLGLEPEKIRVITNGIDCDTFIPGPARNGATPVVGCFARVVPVKGIEVLIKAAKIVVEKCPVSFVVVGEIQDKEYHHDLVRLVEKLGLTREFSFVGLKNSIEWFHKVDIFTLSSYSEGVPYALLEAMGCGLPAVCTAVGGVPEIISSPSFGFLVPPDNPEALAEKLELLVMNKNLRRQMGTQAQKEANTRFHVRDMADRFLKVYESLCYGR